MMPITYSIDAEQRLILETWSGSVDASQLGEYWLELLEDEQALAIRRNLSDLRDCDIRFGADELWSLVQWMLVPRLAGRKWVSAIVIDKPSALGITHHFQAFSKTFSSDQIFFDYQAAREWVLRQDAH